MHFLLIFSLLQIKVKNRFAGSNRGTQIIFLSLNIMFYVIELNTLAFQQIQAFFNWKIRTNEIYEHSFA